MYAIINLIMGITGGAVYYVAITGLIYWINPKGLKRQANNRPVLIAHVTRRGAVYYE